MKATGIVRRVDDLGRIVIPKEIRRTLRIREGDPLEIYTEKDGGVIFRKYSPMGDLQEFAAQMCEAIGASTGRIAAVSDRDTMKRVDNLIFKLTMPMVSFYNLYMLLIFFLRILQRSYFSINQPKVISFFFYNKVNLSFIMTCKRIC